MGCLYVELLDKNNDNDKENNMVTKIYPAEYSHIDNPITIDGVVIKSSYNNNYYMNKNYNNIIIFEDCNDDGKFDYKQIFIVDGEKISAELGCDYGRDSIFGREPGDYGLYSDGEGYYVELDTNIC